MSSTVFARRRKRAQIQSYSQDGANVFHDTAVSCAKTAEPIDLPFGFRTRMDEWKHMFDRIRQVAPTCQHGKPHCRHMAKTIELSVCGGDAVLCQITLTTSKIYDKYSKIMETRKDKPITILN